MPRPSQLSVTPKHRIGAGGHWAAPRVSGADMANQGPFREPFFDEEARSIWPNWGVMSFPPPKALENGTFQAEATFS